VLTEALANVARHARATAVEVTVDADDELTVRVSDNGCGVADFSRHSGVRNMAARATALRGTFRMVPNRPAGTVIEWEAPLA
jgi:signal transduction histidine kinase